jgi:hypothetical protein
LFDGIYWLVPPVLVPAISGIIGVVLYDLFVTPALAEKEPAPAPRPAAMD